MIPITSRPVSPRLTPRVAQAVIRRHALACAAAQAVAAVLNGVSFRTVEAGGSFVDELTQRLRSDTNDRRRVRVAATLVAGPLYEAGRHLHADAERCATILREVETAAKEIGRRETEEAIRLKAGLWLNNPAVCRAMQDVASRLSRKGSVTRDEVRRMLFRRWPDLRKFDRASSRVSATA